MSPLLWTVFWWPLWCSSDFRLCCRFSGVQYPHYWIYSSWIWLVVGSTKGNLISKWYFNFASCFRTTWVVFSSFLFTVRKAQGESWDYHLLSCFQYSSCCLSYMITLVTLQGKRNSVSKHPEPDWSLKTTEILCKSCRCQFSSTVISFVFHVLSSLVAFL